MSCASLRGCARSGFGLMGCAISGPMLSASFFLSRSMGHLMRSPIWTGQWNSWLRSTACLAESAAFVSGKSPTAKGSISTISPCGLCSRCVGALRASLSRQGNCARAIHRPFVVPGRGVIWKMKEDLSGPYPGYGFGALDAFDGYVSYRLLDERALSREIAEMRSLIDGTAGDLVI